MKLEDPKQLRQQRSASAALKREIRSRFAWLDGAPATTTPGTALPPDGAIPWLLFKKDKKFCPHLTTVSRDDIRRAVSGPGYLRRTFPRALPRLVKNVEVWSDSHTMVPSLLKDARRLPDPLEVLLPSSSANTQRRALELSDHFPALAGLVSTLIWRLPHDGSAVVADLKLLGKIAPQFHRIIPAIVSALPVGDHSLIEVQLRVLHLGSLVSPVALVPFLELLAHPALQTPQHLAGAIPLDELQEFARSEFDTPRTFPPITAGGGTHFQNMVEFALHLSGMEKAGARSCLNLFLDVFPRPLLKPLAAWWGRWAALRPYLERLYRNPDQFSPRERRALAKKCGNLKQSIIQLPNVPSPVLAAKGRAWGRPVQRLICALPSVIEKMACRVEMLRYYNGRPISKRAYPVIAGLERFFSVNPPGKIRDLGPWARSFRRGNSWERYEENISRELDSPHGIQLYFEALKLILERKSGDTGDLDALSVLVAGTGDPSHAAELCLAIDAQRINCSGDHDAIYILAALDRATDTSSFLEGLKSLFEVQSRLDYDHEQIGVALLEKLRLASEHRLYQQLVDESDCRTLVHLARLCSILDGPPPPLPRVSARRARWMARYPADFYPLLRALRSFLPADVVEKRVGAILGKEFPDRDTLQNELDHIETKLAEKPSGGLEARAKKLRGWIDSPPEVSPARLNRLGQKLQRAASECRLDRWRANIFEMASEKLSGRLANFPDLDRWLGEPKLLRHVLGVAALSATERRHPLSILRAIQDPGRAQDFRDKPENQRFRRLLEAKGLDLAPWVDGVGTQAFSLDDGSELEMALEDDPFEILDMGYHFSTCLSPLGCNYFSVFANISDLNKRIVYGRTGGKVRARCLLALCEEGTVLVFHPYNHGIGEKFAELVTTFAESLATAMGTVVTPHGSVPTLVSKNWYDDGPIDVGQRFDFLRDGSDFRTELRKIDPANFRARIFEEISELDALTIPYLIHLPEFDERHFLLPQIIGDISRAEHQLPKRTLLRAAELAELGGEPAFAQQMIQRHARQFLLSGGNLQSEWSVIWLLVRYDPSTALGVIRKQRGKGVRSWEQDTENNVLAAAEAYFLLNRPKIAKRLFGRLKAKSFGEEMKRHILGRRRELS